MAVVDRDSDVQPHDIDAERALLGSVVLRPYLLHEVSDVVEGRDFYRAAHRLIWDALLAIDADGLPIDAITLNARLRMSGHLDQVGGPAYVASLIDGLPRSDNARGYAEIVRHHADRRRAIAMASHAAASIRGGARVEEVAATLTDQMAQIRGVSEGGLVPIGEELCGETVVRSAERHLPIVVGVPTGFARLDELLGGFHRGDLILLAGRTSHGKTALALDMASHAAGDRPVAVFSLEMAREQIVQRLIVAAAGVDGHRFRRGVLGPQDLAAVRDAWERVKRLRLWIDDTSSLSASMIRARCHALIARINEPIGLVVVDYLQLVPAGRRYESRTQEVSAVSAALKAVAKDLDVPVLALSQLSRAVEQRRGKPRLSDLRESGALEQDADVVLLLWRPPTRPTIADLIVAKHRNGPTGTIRLVFRRESSQFGTPDPTESLPDTEPEDDADDD